MIARPGAAALASGLVVTLVVGPAPLGCGGGAAYHWELADRLGSSLVMLGANGERLVHRTLTPFGEVYAAAGPRPGLRDYYAGHLRDADTGLVYMQARWMDPATGTFLSVDPLVADSADPQSHNAYAYARNNPVGFNDPTGMSCATAMHGGSCYKVDTYVQGTTLFTVYTSSAAAAGAAWFGPFEVPLPDSVAGGGFGGGSGLSLGDIGGGSLAGLGALGGGGQTSAPAAHATASQSQSSGAALATAAETVAAVGLGVGAAAETAKQFPSTKTLAPRLTRVVVRRIVPAEMAIHVAQAGVAAEQGEVGKAAESATDAAVAGGLAYASGPLGLSPAVALALGTGYFLAGGSGGFAGALGSVINPTHVPRSIGWPGAPAPVSSGFIGGR